MAFGTIRNVRKVFSAGELLSRSSEPVVALDDANFEFEQGQLVALLGPSGCGKTTLLRIVAGLIPKTSGSVVIGGREVVEPLGDYGFVFQSPSLMPWRSVIDNVLFPMEILKRNSKSARQHALRSAGAGRPCRAFCVPARINCQAACSSAWRCAAR